MILNLTELSLYNIFDFMRTVSHLGISYMFLRIEHHHWVMFNLLKSTRGGIFARVFLARISVLTLLLFCNIIIVSTPCKILAQNQGQALQKDNALRQLSFGISLHEAGDYVQAERVLLGALQDIRKHSIGAFWEASCYEQLGVVYKKSGLTERSVQFFQYAQEILRRDVPMDPTMRENNAIRSNALERMVIIVHAMQANPKAISPSTAIGSSSQRVPLTLNDIRTMDSTSIARYVRNEVESLLRQSQLMQSLPDNTRTTQTISEKSSSMSLPQLTEYGGTKTTPIVSNSSVVVPMPIKKLTPFTVGGSIGGMYPFLPAGLGLFGSSAFTFEVQGAYLLDSSFSAVVRAGGVSLVGYSATPQTLVDGSVLAPNIPNSSFGYATACFRYTLAEYAFQPFADIGVGIASGGASGIALPLTIGIAPSFQTRIHIVVETQFLNVISSGVHTLYWGVRGGLRYRL